jgi:phasin family protein
MAKTKTVQAEATETVTNAFAAGTERFEQAQAQMMSFFTNFGDLAKGNMEAFKAASAAATKGFEVLGKAAADYTKDAAAATQETFATLRTAKTPKEFFELNQSRTKAHFDHFAGEASKMTELLVKVAGDVTQPISNRYAVAMDQATKAAR